MCFRFLTSAFCMYVCLCGHILFAKVDIGEKCERQNQVRRDETERTVTRAMAMEAAEGGSY